MVVDDHLGSTVQNRKRSTFDNETKRRIKKIKTNTSFLDKKDDYFFQRSFPFYFGIRSIQFSDK